MTLPMKKEGRRFDVDAGEVGIVIRKGGDVEVMMSLGNEIGRGQLLGLAVAWSCESDDWKTSMMRRARERLIQIMDEEGIKYA